MRRPEVDGGGAEVLVANGRGTRVADSATEFAAESGSDTGVADPCTKSFVSWNGFIFEASKTKSETSKISLVLLKRWSLAILSS